jgi:hypothetical protein
VKVHLLNSDRDFVLEPPASSRSGMARSYSADYGRSSRYDTLTAHQQAILQDLTLETLFSAMAGDDEFLFRVAQQVVFAAPNEELKTILYRQAVLKDCLRNEGVIRNLYNLVVETIENRRHNWWFGIPSSFPSGILRDGVGQMELFADALAKLKLIADEHSPGFESDGFRTFFNMLQAELPDDYFAAIKSHLKELDFPRGVLVSAELGKGNQGVNYVLRKEPWEKNRWWQRLFGPRPPGLTFHLDPRDEAGARALSELRDRGINLVANALAQSAEHVLSFFVVLRNELAFYIGCLNLHQQLAQKQAPVCFPVPVPSGNQKLSCAGLRDPCLVLNTDQTVVGNDLEADGRKVIIVTGANQGGKSTFLRSVGQAQLMMQCGMFVAAEAFSTDVRRGLFTHFKREEDPTMKSGKLDEELSRMSAIVDALVPDSMLLFNESFAATNEREGSEISRQIVRALMEAPVKIVFVTHLYDFAHRLWAERAPAALFLRADRQPDGQRTFKVQPGDPLQTSFGADLYQAIFEGARPTDGESPTIIANKPA